MIWSQAALQGRGARATSFAPRARHAAAAATGLVVLVALVGLAAPARSVVSLAGYQDFVYGAAGPEHRATTDKAQSKAWFAGGSWWADMFQTSTGASWKIWKLSADHTTWTKTTTLLDTRNESHADHLFDAGTNTLDVASAHPLSTKDPTGALRFYRATFNGTSWTASPPITIATGGQKTATIAKDSTGEIWIAWPGHGATDGKIMLRTSTNNGVTWNPAFQLPTQGEPIKPGYADGDVVAIVSFTDSVGPAVGVLWSSTAPVAPADEGYYFAVHRSGDPDGTWSAPATVISGAGSADDHLNVKVTSTGRVLAVIKNGKDGSVNKTLDVVNLLDRNPATGTWKHHVVSTVAEDHSRPQLVVDDELGAAYVFMTAPKGGGAIYEKSASFADLDTENGGGTATFGPGIGQRVIASSTQTTIDDPATTKQAVTAASGIVVLAADFNTETYFHAFQSLAASDSTAPTGTVSINNGATFATNPVSVAVPGTDTGSGLALVRLSNDSTLNGSGVLTNGTSFAYGTPISWTLPGSDGAKTVYVQWRDTAGNWSSVTSDDITLDKTGPSGAITIDGGASATNQTAATLSVPATDAGVGTVANVRIANAGTTTGGILSDASAVTRPYAASQAWTLPGGDGGKTVYAQWQDGLGNWSGVSSDSIALDQTPPAAGAVSIDSDAQFTHDLAVSLDLSASPGDATQVRAAESLAGLGSATPVAVAASVPFNLAAGLDGTRTVYVQWGDAASNWSSAASDAIILDMHAPSGNAAINGGAVGTHSLSVTLSFPNSDTDIDQVTVSNNSSMTGSQTFGTTGTIFTGTIPWTLAGALTNGQMRTVWVTFHDLSGQSSAAATSDSILIDLTRPVAKAPVTTRLVSPRTLGTSTVPVWASWPAGTDSGSGIGSYRIQSSVDSHPYVTLATVTTLGTNVYVHPGHAYRIRVAAIDRAGNISASVYSAVFRVLHYSERNLAVKFSSGWHLTSGASYFAGFDRWARIRGTSVRLTFSGRSVAWVATRALNRGYARVYIDGRLAATVNLWSSTTLYRQQVWARSWSTIGTHTIRIVVLGTAGHPLVDLDAFTVLR